MLFPDFNDLVALKDRKSNLMHPSFRSVKSTVAGNHHSPFRGQGLEFDSVREYVPGDDIRSIDWRVTARMGSPHVKLFKEERERHIVICVDMNASMRFGTRNTFKSIQAARVAAILGWKGIAHQDRISACLFGDVPCGIQFFAPKRTRTSFCALLKMVAEPFVEQHHVPLENALRHISRSAHTGSLIYLISDFMEIGEHFQKEASVIRLNNKCDVVFIAINDRSDQSIYPVGPIGFCANDKEKMTVNTESIAGREAYAAQWKQNRQHLYEITARLKIPMIGLTTESDVHRELTLGLNSIAKGKKR
jgi:uncharacterized protein (DUF58 family)